MALVRTDELDLPETRLHAAAITAEDDLYASIEAMGILTPLVVTAHANRYRVVDGVRRLQVAVMLGLTEVPVHVEANLPGAWEQVAAVATNLVRAPVSAVAQWRALAKVQADRGPDINAAARSLGMDPRHARKLAKLGSIHPDVLAAIALEEEAGEDGWLLPDRDLAHIAGASHETQIAAFKRQQQDDGGVGDWAAVVDACRTRCISRATAIFDHSTAGVLFEEDLFAEPGTANQFITSDTAGFLAAQRAALAAEVAKHKGWRVAAWAGGNDALEIPAGFRRDLTARTKPHLAKTDTRLVLAGVCTDSRDPGGIYWVVCSPVAAKGAKPAPAEVPQFLTPAAPPAEAEPPEDSAGEAAEDDAPARLAAAPEAARNPVTMAGRDMIAEAKSTALKAALRNRAEPHSWRHFCAWLLLALHADNVSVTIRHGYGSGLRDARAALFRQLATPLGTIDLPEDDALATLVGETLAQVLSITTPSREGMNYHPGSGRVAEWIGAAIAAEQMLPRFDTVDLLATVTGDALRAAALDAGFAKPPAKVTDLRERLKDHLPAWLPPGAEFGAPGPEPAPDDEPEGEA